ncbi:MAG: hypothetical protein HUJ70_09110, partial [Pseudobutyrivibrio sp.]|nr:hypothetical protein [Pseudobutyrivibrio sp.]
SPSGLVFYWTLNNVFSLVKTVFYKLKNPRKALNTILAIGGVAVMAAGVLSVGKITLAYILVILMVGAVMLMPALISALASRISFGSISFTKEPHPKWFFAAMIFLAVMVGGFIPSMVIRSSPQEFIDSITNLNPVMFIASALCYSAGFFLVWMGVFYWIADKKVKPFFEMGAVVYCCLAVFNYFGFNSTSGLLSNTLISSNGLLFLTSTLLINTGLTVVVLAVAGFAYIKLSSYLVKIAGIAAVALMALTVVNAVEINNNVKPFLIDSNHEDEIPVFQLSTDGQNVVVIMVDRALSEFFPYIVDEKPELKESFSGFTFYPNTLSFGLITKIASPALFGGYEYTPDAINSKDEQTLIEKQNEADKMMPVLFSENGFDTVVCDPVYPNYQWKTDLSIFNEYPDISAYKMIGNLKGDYEVGIIKKDKRNFYCFGLMKTMPLFFQKIVYNDGAYLNASRDKVVEGQIWKDDFSASGIDADYYTSYTALDNLDNITTVCEDDSNHFLMFRNDITHGPTMLQMPGYEMKWEVDNTEYFDGQLPTEFTLSDNSASYNNNGFYSYLFYQVNMSAMTKLAEWLDYLKECGVYDNTRIIIVADHGHGLGNNPELQMDYEDSSDQYAERVYDMTAYNPLLLVKDFDESEFKVSEKFMTNADVPTLAAEGVIDNPVNPFTGNSINSNRKEQDVLYVFGTSETNIEDGKNNTYEPGDWFSVYDEVHDINNWSVVKQNAVLPY